MHVAAAILCVGVFTCAGLLKAYSERERSSAVKALRDDIHTLSVQIELTSEPLEGIFGRLVSSEKLHTLWSDMQSGLKEGLCCSEAWNASFCRCSKVYTAFTDAEKSDICGYFASLGKTDRQTQKKSSERIYTVLCNAYERVEEQAVRSERLYRSLGVLCGLGVGIAVL